MRKDSYVSSQLSEVKYAIHVKKEQLYLKLNSGKYCLIIQKRNIDRDIFRIYDVEEDVIYRVQGYHHGKELYFQLIDNQKKTAGTIRKKPVSRIISLFRKSDYIDYKIEVGGQRAATLRKLMNPQNQCYTVIPFGWTVKSDSGKRNFTLYDGWQKAFHFNARSGYGYPTFIADYADEYYEVIGILISLALIDDETES